jgi:predicted enzyme related to lactoylglutathione lyase
MQIAGVDTVFVKVTDLDRSLAWYRQALGLAAGPRYGDWQILEVGGTTVFALHRFDEHPGAVNAVVALAVDDLDAAIDQAVARGIQPIDPDVTDAGPKRFTTFEDPDGNHVQLIGRATSGPASPR